MLFPRDRQGDEALLLSSRDDAASLRLPAMSNGEAPLLPLSASRLQVLRFCVVGLLGTFVNLAVYAGLIGATTASPHIAAVVAFCVAVGHNHLLHRLWTFERRDAAYLPQGARCLGVSLVALVANLLVLRGLLLAGAGDLEAQALAIAAATPVSFAGNRLWAFGART